MIFSRISMGVHPNAGGVQVDSKTNNLFLIILCSLSHVDMPIIHTYIILSSLFNVDSIIDTRFENRAHSFLFWFVKFIT